jgi:hypothetical protein
MKRKAAIVAFMAMLFGLWFWTANSCGATTIRFDSYPGVGNITVNISQNANGAPPPIDISPMPYQYGPGGSAGEFQVTLDPGPSQFQTIAYCAQFAEFISIGGSYPGYALQALPNDRFKEAGWLIQTYAPGLVTTSWWGSATPNQARAAVQMAVWEVLYENSSLNVSSDNFRITGDSTAISLANNTLLAAVTNHIGDFSAPNVRWAFLEGYRSNGVTWGQDMLVVVPGTTTTVPIPSVFLLMGSGLLSLLGVRRRFFG